MNETLSGILAMGYFVAGTFFLKFWRRTSDRLFAMFSLAFFILGAQRLLLSPSLDRDEDGTIFYLIRLAAFSLILIGIWQKNRESARG